jgi:hypothetical protein
MDKGNLNVSHLAWCGLVALHTARLDGQIKSPAQDNLFLTRWLASAEKQRRFPKALASDISWLLREGRAKGLRADLPGKLDYLWQAESGNLSDQNDLFRLLHAFHAVKLADWACMVLTDAEWSGRRQQKLSPGVSGIYLSRTAMDNGFCDEGRQLIALPARITGELPALDALLNRSGWRRTKAAGDDPLLHYLLAVGFTEE